MESVTSLRFASFELDIRSRELRRGDARVRLQDQPFEILRVMLERPGEVVTREELQRRLWPEGTFVDFEHSLNAAVKRLRAALGDDAENPRFVETLPRRGYRFIASLDADQGRPVKTRPDQASPNVRLAVLPFSNLSDDSSQEYFSDGLTEELISQLGPVCRGRISVIARVSSMAFKGTLQRAAEIAEQLRADYLLEGSVRRDGCRVRITVRLIEGATETELWSETYDRTVDDWLSAQAEVASHVARSLLLELVPPSIATRPPEPAAHHAYLRARYQWGRPGDEGYSQALRYLDESIRIAPDFAASHGLRARVLVGAAEYYRDVPRVALAAAHEAAQRALVLDPTNCEAQVVTAEVARMVDFDWDAARQRYREALTSNPSSELAHRGYAFLLGVQGRHEDATRAAELARELDPLCLVPSSSVAWTLYLARRYEDAARECRHTIEMGERYVPAWRLLGAALLQLGDVTAAIDALQDARARAGDHPLVLAWLAHATAMAGDRDEAVRLISALRSIEDRYVSPYHLAVAFLGIDSIDAAFESLAQAFVDRDPHIAHLIVEPCFDSLRNDARYRRLVGKMNLG
jgi:TolB-like protein/Flp pilus assembly protein TadD